MYTRCTEADQHLRTHQTRRRDRCNAANPEALVIRTSWVLSSTHRNFAAMMIRLSRQGEISVVDDQHGHPTLVNNLAGASFVALNCGATGILHLINIGATTWFSLDQEVVELAGLTRDRICPCTTSDYPTAAKRPANSILDSERLDRLKLDTLPLYRPGLRQAISEILNWLPQPTTDQRHHSGPTTPLLRSVTDGFATTIRHKPAGQRPPIHTPATRHHHHRHSRPLTSRNTDCRAESPTRPPPTSGRRPGRCVPR